MRKENSQKKTRLITIIVTVFFIIGLIITVGLYNNWFTPGRLEAVIHFSVDDVIDVFEDLTDNQESYDSIFDNEMLEHFREMHELYGAKFSLYCFYERGSFSLSDVPEKYHDEFMNNSDWLRFGYHAMNSSTDPAVISVEDIENEYLLTVSELERITGSVTDTLRLSMFQGNRQAMIRLKQLGVKTLLTADDNRNSYYLNESESKYIANHDSYEDGYFRFVSTDLRLDDLSRIVIAMRLIHIIFDQQQNKILVVFTHEGCMDEEMYKKIREVCFFSEKHHYRFVLDP